MIDAESKQMVPHDERRVPVVVLEPVTNEEIDQAFTLCRQILTNKPEEALELLRSAESKPWPEDFTVILTHVNFFQFHELLMPAIEAFKQAINRKGYDAVLWEDPRDLTFKINCRRRRHRCEQRPGHFQN